MGPKTPILGQNTPSLRQNCHLQVNSLFRAWLLCQALLVLKWFLKKYQPSSYRTIIILVSNQWLFFVRIAPECTIWNVNFSNFPRTPRGAGTPHVNQQGGQEYFLGCKILGERYFSGVLLAPGIFLGCLLDPGISARISLVFFRVDQCGNTNITT